VASYSVGRQSLNRNFRVSQRPVESHTLGVHPLAQHPIRKVLWVAATNKNAIEGIAAGLISTAFFARVSGDHLNVCRETFCLTERLLSNKRLRDECGT
jgi:hypothetical protein